MTKLHNPVTGITRYYPAEGEGLMRAEQASIAAQRGLQAQLIEVTEYELEAGGDWLFAIICVACLFAVFAIAGYLDAGAI